MTKLDDTVQAINKQHGRGSIFLLGGKDKLDIEVASTGIPELDAAIGIGGLPKGRVTEIFGPESGGKTTLTLHIIAEIQKSGGQAAFVDAEHALNKNYAQHLGVDVDKLLVSQPDSGEQALEIVDSLIQSGQVQIIVVDSVAALVPRAELEGEMGDPQMALQARLLSQAMRKLTAVLSKSKAILIFINQIRESLAVTWGSKEVTTGGRALKFYSSVRIDVRKTKAIKKGDKVIGAETRVRVVKNKCAAPFQEAELTMHYGEGFVKSL
jgi:recombination protein RecA